MLQRITHPNGLVTYHSPLLEAAGVRHGFSTRLGGASEGAYASLNLGRMEKDPATDSNGHIMENFRRLRLALGLQQYIRADVRQVHSGNVWQAPAQPVRPRDTPEADAVVTTAPRIMATIRTADCVPLLLASRDGRAVAAIHAGWRGLEAGVIANTLRLMSSGLAVALDGVVAAIGPCISVEHYEVGEDVASRFIEADLADCIDCDRGERPHLCLRSAARLQLERGGVGPTLIDTTDACTYRDEAEFFSYRRDVTHHAGPRTGHMAAVIAINHD